MNYRRVTVLKPSFSPELSWHFWTSPEGLFSNGQMRFPDWNEQYRNGHSVINRLRVREHKGFLEIQIVDLAILRLNMSAIGDLDLIALCLDLC
jgi:hypothetical protein